MTDVAPSTAEHKDFCADPTEILSPRLRQALAYAAAGIPVFACAPNSKSTRKGSRAYMDATTDERVIRGWWSEADYNIGICPEDAGWYVVDLDDKNGKGGTANWNALPFEKPRTRTVETPSGGRHLYFEGSLPPSVGKLAPGIDIRGQRSYVLVPPSIVDGKPYKVIDNAEIALGPEGMRDHLRSREHAKLTAPEGVELDQPWNVDLARDYLKRMYDKGAWGQEDDADTFVIAAAVKDQGISAERTADLMMEYLPEDEREWLTKTVYNAFNYGQNEPGARALPDPAVWGVAKDDRAQSIEPAAGNMAEPVDLFSGALTPEPMLRRDMLPRVIADFAFDRAKLLGVEPSMVAMPALAVCASALHDGIKIQPKAHDTNWTESARLWLAMLAPPGGKKTPAMNAATAPLSELEQRQRKDDGRKLADYETALDRYKHHMRNAAGDPPPPPSKPPMRRFMVSDVTMEKLADILAENERGVLKVHDELAEFIGGFDAYRGNGVQKDRAAALELWNGGYRTIDRKSGSVAVPNWGASIVGGIQPDKLREMAARSKMADDGLLQRFVLFTGRTIGTGEDREPDYMAGIGYAAVVRRLANLEPPLPAKAVRLSAGARLYWQEVEQLAHAMQCLPATSAALKGHLAKVPGTFARLLLTFHAIECAAGGEVAGLAPDVSADTAKRAHELMVRFFLPQAIRTYGDLFQSADAAEPIRRVARAILLHGDDRITERDIYRACRELQGDEHAQERQRIMRALVGYRWVEAIDEPMPSAWRVNPALRALFAAERAAERKRRDDEARRVDEATGITRRTYG